MNQNILEEHIAIKLSQYIKAQYPKLIFRNDFGADTRLSKTQRRRQKALQMVDKGYPDYFIAEAKNGYHGMYIELKKRYSDVFKKDGTFKKDEHIETQHKMHERLRAKGYYVVFGLGFDHAKLQLDNYMKGKI
jgi:hypothetical protein